MREAQSVKGCCWALALAVLTSATSFGQDKPPASVPEPYRQKFVKYVDDDKRPIFEKLLNTLGLTFQPVGRSFALIAGVSKYPKLPTRDQIPAARNDVEN